MDPTLDPLLRNLLSSLDEDALKRGLRPAAGTAHGRVVRAGTALDRRRRVVLPGRLFTHEAIDSSVSFIGRIHGEIRDVSADHGEAALLSTSLEALSHLGGAKGRGMGHCIITVDKLAIDGAEVGRDGWNAALATLGGPH
jgi:CRISPR/Cas system CSM-associated protein Csm3 (group 7 of RAMP superfamily)